VASAAPTLGEQGSVEHDRLATCSRVQVASSIDALANNGHVVDAEALDDLNDHLRSTPMIGRFRTSNDFHLEGTGSAVDRVLGRLAAILTEEVIRGRWFPLKACARDACRWVFFDHSRNRTGTWCTMAICGSRTKVNAYYWRHNGTGGRSSRASESTERPARSGS
jgi:predicted RNA-binding Zn ribbon-like protein